MTPDTEHSHELSCRDLVELVTEYLEDAMDPTTRERFEQHAGDCPACLEHLDQIKLTVWATGRMSREAISPEARSALMAQFRGWKAERPN